MTLSLSLTLRCVVASAAVSTGGGDEAAPGPGAAADDPSAAEILERMAARVQECPGFRARTSYVEILANGKSYPQRYEMHWDGTRQALRCRWSYVDAPYPMFTAILTM